MHRLGHLLGRHRPPVDVVTRPRSDLPQELARRPAIAFAKRISGIDLAGLPGCAGGKGRGIEAGKVVLGRGSLLDPP